MNSFNVIIGPAALKFGKYWVGYASGNISTHKRRIKVKDALIDAEKLEKTLEK